jgi:hypothetical protein
MAEANTSRQFGLEFNLQRPDAEEWAKLPASRDEQGNVIYPEVDADQDHVHFEMVPMRGDSLLWLTIRRGTTPQLASASLRKIAALIDRHGEKILNLPQGEEGSFNSEGGVVEGPLRLGYDEHGDLIFPDP